MEPRLTGTRPSYWNSPYEPEEYNFVQYAINEGYSVFFYDRLGTGLSSKYETESIRLPCRTVS
jgi:hypothetical protein